jgi:uncharacterized protein
MTSRTDPNAIRTLAQLELLYGQVGESSIRKEVTFIHPQYRALIEASPFAILASAGPDGMPRRAATRPASWPCRTTTRC